MIEVCWGLATEYKKSSHISFYRENKYVVKQGGNIFNDLKSCILLVVLNVSLFIFLGYPCLTASMCSCLGDVLSGIFPPVCTIVPPLSEYTDLLFVYLGHLFISGYTDLSSKRRTIFHHIYLIHTVHCWWHYF